LTRFASRAQRPPENFDQSHSLSHDGLSPAAPLAQRSDPITEANKQIFGHACSE